jgi:acetyl-CoA carboxylase carboxyltransferase component
MSKTNSYMFVTGPKVVKTVTGEVVTDEELGGAMVHGSKSGVSHFVAEDEQEGILLLRKILSYLPQNNLEDPPLVPCIDPIDRLEESLNEIVPENPNKPYDIKDVIHLIADNNEFLEVARHFAPNIVVGFARFNGMSIGIVANQPNYLAGVLDINASRKAARFVRFCDAFNVPILTLVDVPGFLPGTAQEYGGIIIHGAKLLFAYGEATVPKVTVILRKAYGGAYDVMSSKHLRGDINYAWPSAEIAVMGPKGAIEVLYHKKLAEIEDPSEREVEFHKYENEYKTKFANPYDAAKYGFIDDIIVPRNTRFRVIRAFQALSTKKDTNPAKKHSNLPL